MKTTKIYYKKLFNLGDYENEEIGIELEAEENETALELLDKAKLFVKVHSTIQHREIEQAHKTIINKDDYMNRDVENANHALQGYDYDKSGINF